MWGDSYSCSFESAEGWSSEKISYINYTTPGTGWGVIGDGSSALLKFYTVSAEANSGSQSLGAASNSAFYAVSPKLAKGNISFYARNNGGGSVTIYKATFDGSSYSINGSAIETFSSLSSSFVLKSFNLDEDSYVAFKLTSSIIDDFSAANGLSEESTLYPPIDFVLSSFTATTATFCWTAGNSETAWQLAYSTNENFTPGTDGTTLDITDNPHTLTGLTAGTTYYAAIRADYGDGNYSEWTERVSFTPRAEVETTINDGTNTNSYIPLYGSAYNTTSNASQFILPASQLTAVNGRQITQIVFHTTSSYDTKDWGNAKWEVYMNETSSTSFSSKDYLPFGTKVFNAGTLAVSNQKLIIILDTPFNYNGGNLLIGFKTTTAQSGSSGWCTFYGVTTSEKNAYYYNASNLVSFYPKMTITSTPITTDPVQMGLNGYTTYASPRALDLAKLPSGLKAYKASTIDGTRVRFTEIDDVVAANTGILLEGNASETYNIPVATTSGNDISDSNLFFVNSTGGTFTAESGYTYYGMIKATSAADPIVFGTFAPGSVAIPTNRAYLKVANSGGTSRLTCVFDNGGTTGVQTVNAEPLTVNQYFDLQGRRVAQPTRGLYIINGKKVVIK